MRRLLPKSLGQLLAMMAVVLVLKVTASVVINYRNYLPPNFSSDFLRGREGHFGGPYRWAFYTHIASGPITLVAGLILVVTASGGKFPPWHRYLGWFQVASILLLLTPSGLWMAYYAAAGPVGGIGLAILAIATATTAALGTRSAIQRRFSDHRRWMWRCFLLLCSAVVLRVFGGFGTVMKFTASWFDPLAIWLSWILPLAVFEIASRLQSRWSGVSGRRSSKTS